jgi:hypothetical protein
MAKIKHRIHDALIGRVKFGFFIKFVYVIIFAIIIFGATYWWRDKKAGEIEKSDYAYASSLRQTIVNLNQQLLAEKIKNNSANEVVCGENAGTPVDSILTGIKSAINFGNTESLLGYMSKNVSILQVESAVVTSSNPKAAASLISNYISNNSSFWNYNFSLPASVLSSYGNGSYGKYFSNAPLVGKSGDGRVLSFSFDCDDNISVVLFAYNENNLK